MSMPGTEAVDVDYADLDQVEASARDILHPAVYDFFAGGAGDESALAANRASWLAIRLRPRVLRPASHPDASVTVLGSTLAAPIAIAPMGYQRLAHPDGERASAVAAARVGAAMTMSTYATTRLEDVRAAAPDGVQWFQSYILQDRGLTADLLQRAAASGFTAVLLTVDATVPGDRRRDRRHGYVLPHADDIDLPNLGGMGLDAAYSRRLEANLGPEVIGWVREVSGLPVAVKGVLHPDDARACVEAGAAAVVVSNHGGRQLDAAIGAADALADVADAVADRADVLVDGGVRCGADVVRALALGARAVLIGRPVLWALANQGEEGVTRMLTSLIDDIGRCLRMCGAASVTELGPDVLARVR
jgi:4-hydroxymandelate oxidase